MQIRDVTCQQCRSAYRVAISDSIAGNPGQFECKVCAEVIDRWTESKLRVYRMMPPEGEAPLPVSSGSAIDRLSTPNQETASVGVGFSSTSNHGHVADQADGWR